MTSFLSVKKYQIKEVVALFRNISKMKIFVTFKHIQKMYYIKNNFQS